MQGRGDACHCVRDGGGAVHARSMRTDQTLSCAMPALIENMSRMWRPWLLSTQVELGSSDSDGERGSSEGPFGDFESRSQQLK